MSLSSEGVVVCCWLWSAVLVLAFVSSAGSFGRELTASEEDLLIKMMLNRRHTKKVKTVGGMRLFSVNFLSAITNKSRALRVKSLKKSSRLEGRLSQTRFALALLLT